MDWFEKKDENFMDPELDAIDYGGFRYYVRRKWERAISQDLISTPEKPWDAEDMKTLMSEMSEMNESELLYLVLEWIFKAYLPFPRAARHPALKKLIPILREMYLSPLSWQHHYILMDRSLSLTLAQFAVLQQVMRSARLHGGLPLLQCPPEYWYYYCGARMYTRSLAESVTYTALIRSPQLKTLPLKPFTATLFPEDYRTAEASLHNFGGQDLPRFRFSNNSLRLTREMYDEWPQYWDELAMYSRNSYLATKVKHALDFLQITDLEPVAETLHPEERVLVRSDIYPDSAVADDHAVIIEEVTVSAPAVLESSHLIQEVVPPMFEQGACPCEECDESVDKLDQHYPSDLWKDSLMLAPIYSSVGDKRDGPIVECCTASDLRIDSLYSREPWNWEVLLPEELWKTYIQVDALVAKHHSNALYDIWVHDPPQFVFDVGKSGVKDINYRPPRTFRKFAWLYHQLRMIKIKDDGSYPTSSCVLGSALRVLEVSPAPWGNLVALVEAGLIKTFSYTLFRGEASVPCPYDPDPPYKSVNLLDGMKASTDVKSVAGAYYTQMVGRREEDKEGMMVFDIPAHRNSAMRLLKNAEGEGKSKYLSESVDALPLGQVEAMMSLLKSYAFIIKNGLRSGGRVIIKAFDIWDRRVAQQLYQIARKFYKVGFYANPYSKSLSKEVYVVLSDYKSNDRIEEIMFYETLMMFNFRFISTLTDRLVQVAIRFGRNYRVKRDVKCRQVYYDKRCIGYIGPLYQLCVTPPVEIVKTVRGDVLSRDRLLYNYYKRLQFTEKDITYLLHYQRSYRGFDAGEIPHGDVLNYLNEMDPKYRPLMDAKEVDKIRRMRRCNYFNAMDQHLNDLKLMRND